MEIVPENLIPRSLVTDQTLFDAITKCRGGLFITFPTGGGYRAVKVIKSDIKDALTEIMKTSVNSRSFFAKKRVQNDALYIMDPQAMSPELLAQVEENPFVTKYSHTQRLDFANFAIGMVAAGSKVSALILGPPGLGKTYNVIKCLETAGFYNCSDGAEPTLLEDLTVYNRTKHDYEAKKYFLIKGYSSDKGIFRSLFEHNGPNNIIIYDDCDAALKHPVACDLFKAALESYSDKARIVSWNALQRFEDAELPNRFVVTARVIFISNLPYSKLHPAIRSRTNPIDLTMNNNQLFDHMKNIVSSGEFMPEFDMDLKMESLNYLFELSNNSQVILKDFSLRSLIEAVRIKKRCKELNKNDWKSHIMYSLTHGN